MSAPVITLAGKRAISASVLFPRVGIWIADVVFDELVDVSGFVTLKLSGLELAGTVDPLESGSFQLQSKIRIVGGRLGWRKTVPAKHFHNDAGVKTSTVLDELAASVGETLTGAPSTRLGVDFVRPSSTAGMILSRLAPVWWVGADGGTYIAEDRPTSEITVDFDLLSFEPQSCMAELALDELAGIGVGSLVRSRLDVPIEVRSLELTVAKGGIRARAWGEELAA